MKRILLMMVIAITTLSLISCSKEKAVVYVPAPTTQCPLVMFRDSTDILVLDANGNFIGVERHWYLITEQYSVEVSQKECHKAVIGVTRKCKR